MSTTAPLLTADDESLLQEAALRQWLAAGATDRPRLRQALRQLDQQQWAALQQGEPIEQLMQVRVAHIDRLLSVAWEYFLGDWAAVLCLAATGGYGRW